MFQVVADSDYSGNVCLQVTLEVENVFGTFIVDFDYLTDLIHESSRQILQEKYIHEAYLDEVEHTDLVPVVGEYL